MTPADIIETIILAAILVLILIGIWKEEKLIAFERRTWAKIKRRIRRLSKTGTYSPNVKSAGRRKYYESNI